MSKIPANRDWSLMNDEGSSQGSVQQNHQEVEKEIEKALSESQELINQINQLPHTEDVWIWLSNVAYSVTNKDLNDYYRKKNIRIKKIYSKNAGLFKVSFDLENALKAASIPDNILHNRNMRLRLDRWQIPQAQQKKEEPPRHAQSLQQEPIPQKPASEDTADSEVLALFREMKLSDLHLEIIKSLKSRKG